MQYISSTKTDIIALHDKLSDIIWMRYFIECQGYDIDKCIIFQDNMSVLSLEKNGREYHHRNVPSISKQSTFSSKIITMQEKLILQYCPTGRMWADVLTKPLQGLVI